MISNKLISDNIKLLFENDDNIIRKSSPGLLARLVEDLGMFYGEYDQKVLDIFRKILTIRTEPVVHEGLVYGLQKLGTKEAIELIHFIKNDSDQTVSEVAADVLEFLQE